MTEPRVHVDVDIRVGEVFTLTGAVFHHLVVVLRRIRGDNVLLFNGRGGEYRAVLETVGRRSLTARVMEFRDVSRESPLNVTLCQSVSKGERMDYAIQKAVELGVAEIQPLLTDRVVVRLSEERWQRKQEHWRGIAIAASEQCGRTRVPKIARAVELRDWLAATPAGSLRLVLAPTGGTHAGALKHDGQPVTLLVGPEGGLSEVELKLADLAGFAALSLGPRVLRTETAGVVALSLIQSLWGDVGGPRAGVK